MQACSLSIARRVIAAAGQGGVILVLHLQFDLPVAAVVCLVGGGIAYGVLAGQFFRDLIEGLFQIFLAAHDDHAPASLLCEAPPDSLVAAIGGNQKNVDDGMGALRAFDGIL